MPRAMQHDRLDGKQRHGDDKRRPQGTAIYRDLHRDACDPLPKRVRGRCVGPAAANRGSARHPIVVTQRVGERNRRLPHQFPRIRRHEVPVFIGGLRLLRRRMERHPAVAIQGDLHPCGHVVAGEFRYGVRATFFRTVGTDFAIVVLRQKTKHDATGHAEGTRHQSHGRSVLLAVSHHCGAVQQLADAIVAMTGVGRVIPAQTMREPAGFPQPIGNGLGRRSARGPSSGKRRREAVDATRNVFGLRLADGGGLGPDELSVGRRVGNDAGFAIRQSIRRARGVDRRSRVGVVIKRLRILGFAEFHLRGGTGQWQPIVAQPGMHREPRGEPPTRRMVLDGRAHTTVIGRIRGHRGIGQIPHIAVETIHHRKTHGGAGRQILHGEQHVVPMVLDIRAHAAQRTGVSVRTQRRLVMVAQDCAVPRRHGASAEGQRGGDQHNQRGGNPTPPFEQSEPHAGPCRKRADDDDAGGRTAMAGRRSQQGADREVHENGHRRGQCEPVIVHHREQACEKRAPQAGRPDGERASPHAADRRIHGNQQFERSQRAHPSIGERACGRNDMRDGGFVQQQHRSRDQLGERREHQLPPQAELRNPPCERRYRAEDGRRHGGAGPDRNRPVCVDEIGGSDKRQHGRGQQTQLPWKPRR